MISQRLKRLRLARGLSLEALAAELGGIITKQALSKYEQGKAKPSPAVLTMLASTLGVKAAHLWRDPSIRVEFIAYRKGSGLLKREQERVKSLVTEVLEERIRLQALSYPSEGIGLQVQEIPVNTVEDAEHAAESLRIQWDLGIDSVASVTSVLEDHLVHVLEVEAGEKFDGISAVAYSEDGQRVAAAVVTRRGLPGERQRLNLAHELGHLVLNVAEDADEEQAAFRFAGAFLAPAKAVYRAAGRRRSLIGSEELLLLKQRFGLSLQAGLYRLRDLGVITESYYRQWCMDVNRLGWRRHEPLELPPEQPQWLQERVLRSLAEGLVAQEEAERLLGKQTGAKAPRSLLERRSFMKLAIEERRRILAAQAEDMASHYEQDTDLQGGEPVEY
ncbi:MAG: helix-turn-helix domain-containing protein [Chloroflexi bacterium]|nr:helix-turn-helix domain-containing protein [Chloroflexota bacterium]